MVAIGRGPGAGVASCRGELCLIVYGAVGYFSGSLGDVLAGKPGLAGALRWITGGILVALGLRLAIPKPR